MFRLVLMAILATIISCQAFENNNLNNSCIDLNFQTLHSTFESKFAQVSDTPMFNFAKVMLKVENSLSEINYEIAVRYSKRERTFMRNVNVLQGADGSLSGILEGPLMVLDDVKMMDTHLESGATAILTENSNGEQFLTVNTSQAQTSCTLNLGMYMNVHGKVYTEGVFGVFKFSPDGK